MDSSVPQGQTFLVSRAPWDVPGTGKCAGRSGASGHGKPTLCIIPNNDQECPLSWKSPWDQSQDEPKSLPLNSSPYLAPGRGKWGYLLAVGLPALGVFPAPGERPLQAWRSPVYAELSSDWCPGGDRVAEAGEHRTNSRPAGWQLAGPGEEKLREGSGLRLSYTYRLGGRARLGGGGDPERPHSSPEQPQRRLCALCPGCRRQEGLMGS